MDFGQALQALKEGQAIQRTGWNGKGMYLYLNKGSIAEDNPQALEATGKGIPVRADGISVTAKTFDIGGAGTLTRLPNINMKTASGSIVTGWLASQTDMLADDWDVLPIAS